MIAADVQRRILSQRLCEKAVFGEECRMLVRSWLAFFQRAHSIQVMQLHRRGYNLDAQEQKDIRVLQLAFNAANKFEGERGGRDAVWHPNVVLHMRLHHETGQFWGISSTRSSSTRRTACTDWRNRCSKRQKQLSVSVELSSPTADCWCYHYKPLVDSGLPI